MAAWSCRPTPCHGVPNGAAAAKSERRNDHPDGRNREAPHTKAQYTLARAIENIDEFPGELEVFFARKGGADVDKGLDRQGKRPRPLAG
jgi:hypothetical protein